LLNGPRAPLPAHQPKPACSHSRACLARAPRQGLLAPWLPCAVAGSTWPPGAPPRAPSRRPAPRSASPLSPILPLSLHRRSRASQVALLGHRPHARSPALPVPATAVHHWRLYLSLSSTSPSRSPCSHKLPMVRPPSTGIARRSMAKLIGDFRFMGSSSPPPPSLLTLRVSYSPWLTGARAPFP
jgi:hypothetical protein